MKTELTKLFALMAAVVLAVSATACSSSSSSFKFEGRMDNTIVITAENSDTDAGGSGSIRVGSGEVIVAESDLSSGSVKIRVLASGKAESDAAEAEQVFSAKDTAEFPLPEGEYDVYSQVNEAKTTGSLKLYTKAGETAAAAGASADDEQTAGTGEAASEAVETYDVNSDGEISLLGQAAAAMDDRLEEIWGENRRVSYTEETNTVYIIIWEDGVDSEKIRTIQNWDEFKEDKRKMSEDCQAILDQAGIKDGHVIVQHASATEDISFLTIEDGEVTYDMFAADSEKEVENGEAGGALVMTPEEQSEAIAKYLECKPENVVFYDTGTFNEEERVAIFRYVDDEGNEADLLLLLFDDGSLYGYTPEKELVDAKEALSGNKVTVEKTDSGVGMANPWTEITEEEADRLVARLFKAPEGAEDVTWFKCEELGDKSKNLSPLVQLSFTLNGLPFTARAQQGAPEDADIAGLYVDWTVGPEDATLANWGQGKMAGKTYRSMNDTGYVDLITWYDVEIGIAYSLSTAAADLDGFDIQAIAEQMYAEGK